MESIILGHSQRVADDHYDLRRSPEHDDSLQRESVVESAVAALRFFADD